MLQHFLELVHHAALWAFQSLEIAQQPTVIWVSQARERAVCFS